jgi:hypothetical protein
MKERLGTLLGLGPLIIYMQERLGTLLGLGPLIIYMKERLGTLLGFSPLIIYMKERPSATTYLYLGLLARNFIFYTHHSSISHCESKLHILLS